MHDDDDDDSMGVLEGPLGVFIRDRDYVVRRAMALVRRTLGRVRPELGESALNELTHDYVIRAVDILTLDLDDLLELEDFAEAKYRRVAQIALELIEEDLENGDS